jgi:hypothetical protein
VAAGGTASGCGGAVCCAKTASAKSALSTTAHRAPIAASTNRQDVDRGRSRVTGLRRPSMSEIVSNMVISIRVANRWRHQSKFCCLTASELF